MARLTVECHKFLSRLVLQTYYHEHSRITLTPSCLFSFGKILIYVNTDYYKLHFN